MVLMSTPWNAIEDFKQSEFDSADEPGSGARMKASTVFKLQNAREYSRGLAQQQEGPDADCPYIINSGVRTPEHNKDEGGTPDSSHIPGYAADIKAKTSRERYYILCGLIAAGFNRIGIGRTFIHADDDPSKDPAVTWLYG